MELKMAFRGVVRWYGFYREITGHLQFVTIGHDGSRTIHVGTALVHHQLCMLFRKQGDSRGVVVVEMLMRHEEKVCLGHCGIIYRPISQLCHRVNLYLLSIVLNPYA